MDATIEYLGQNSGGFNAVSMADLRANAIREVAAGAPSELKDESIETLQMEMNSNSGVNPLKAAEKIIQEAWGVYVGANRQNDRDRFFETFGFTYQGPFDD